MLTRRYEDMAKLLPEGRCEEVRLEYFDIDAPQSKVSYLRAALNPHRQCDTPVDPGRYVRLLVNGGLMMTNTQLEERSNQKFLQSATGDVLVAGLGIGLILVPILEQEDVRSVLVIEKYQGVIKLVEPHLQHPKLQIVHEDIFVWKPPKGQLWDTIYFDIWAETCTDNLEEITRLKRKFARRLNRTNSKAWMGAWHEDLLRHIRRQEAHLPWNK